MIKRRSHYNLVADARLLAFKAFWHHHAGEIDCFTRFCMALRDSCRPVRNMAAVEQLAVLKCPATWSDRQVAEELGLSAERVGELRSANRELAALVEQEKAERDTWD